MGAILDFTQFIIQGLLTIIFWLIVVSAVVSWLVAFNVINMRNRTAWQIVRMLDRATEPLMRPLRRIIPTLGGIDFTPVIVLLLIQGLQLYLIPPFFTWLHNLLAPPLM